MINIGWSDERRERVRSLWAEGWSARQIASELGVSRNAIIGLIHRMQPAKERGERPPRTQRPPQKAPKPKTPAKPRLAQRLAQRLRLAERESRRKLILTIEDVISQSTFCINAVPLLELRNGQCRFCFTEGNPYLFCGRKTVNNSSYCLKHARITMTPASLKKKGL